MPQLIVQDIGTFTIPDSKRLVLALTDEAKIDQLHACGGFAKCTTCRVQFVMGEPKKMTDAERSILDARSLLATPGLRLSCQISCDHDMEVKVISRLTGSGRQDAGKAPVNAYIWQRTSRELLCKGEVVLSRPPANANASARSSSKHTAVGLISPP